MCLLVCACVCVVAATSCAGVPQATTQKKKLLQNCFVECESVCMAYFLTPLCVGRVVLCAEKSAAENSRRVRGL